MPRYSDELIEEVRSRNDIVDVISQYVRLSKKGSTYFGLCPFHNEKTGSFSVSPNKQMYYCFGCHAGGNVFTFLMQYENYTFGEAMEALAERLDIKNALPNLISECSHGMKQKIAVIGALIHEPKLILMDEPFVGLDPIAAHELKEIMAEHCRNGGAIFFSTHVLEVAEKLCDNVAIIKNGKLIAHGTMDSVRGDGSLEQVFLELEDHKD